MKEQLLVIGQKTVDMTNRREFREKRELMAIIAEETNVYEVVEKHPNFKIVYKTDKGIQSRL